MTTNTPSQDASIDTREFRLLLADLCEASEFGPDEYAKARAPFVTHIDAKLAQAKSEAATWETYARGVEKRAIDAESRLAEIQRGVEGLERASPILDQVFEVVVMRPNPGGSWITRRQVLALFQPQVEKSDDIEYIHNAGECQR